MAFGNPNPSRRHNGKKSWRGVPRTVRHRRFGTVPGRGWVSVRGELGSPSGARLGAWQRQGSEPTKPAAAHCSSARDVPSPSPVGPVGAQDVVGTPTVISGTAAPPRQRRPKGSLKICDKNANDSEGGQTRKPETEMASDLASDLLYCSRASTRLRRGVKVPPGRM